MQIHQVRKVRRQRRPGYPTRPEVARDPELLRRNVPSAWKKSAQVTAALSIMLASAYAQDAPLKGKQLKVAPIFQHGEGHGSTGCIILNPPHFLDEEEALRAITDELGKAGIPVPERDKTLPGLLVARLDTGVEEVRVQEDGRKRLNFVGIEKGKVPLVLDLFEPRKHIAIVYVSKKDKQFALTGDVWDSVNSMSSVQSRQFVKASEWVRQEILKNDSAPDVYYGVFYEPCPEYREIDWGAISLGSDLDFQKRYREVYEMVNPAPAKLLRAQVRDFVEWLKAQGAI